MRRGDGANENDMKEECINCLSKAITAVDSTYSNVTNERVQAGELTGIIFQCKKCDCLQIDNYLSGQTEPFSY